MIFKKIKNNPEFLKISAYILSTLAGILAFLYLAFLLILPNIIDINKFTPQINEQVEKLTGFKFTLENPALKTTPRLGIKLSAKKVSLKYKDGKDFIYLLEPGIEINLPTLIFRHLNLDKIYVSEANMALVFTKDKKYTLEEYVQNILKNTADGQDQAKEDASLPIELRNINIDAKKATITLEDENISKTFIAQANNSKISLSSLKGPLKISTNGYLGAIENKNNFVDFNIKLQTKLPEMQADDNKKETQPLEFDFNFNPLATLDMFSPQSKLNVDLKISDLGEKFSAKGYLNLEDLTLKINNYQLPKGYIKTSFNKNTIKTVSNIYISKDEFIQADNSITAGKNNKIDLNVKSDKISLNNLKILTYSLLEMFAIKNDLKSASANGTLECDFNLKSDFKKVQSAGKLILKDGNITYPKVSLKLSSINALLDFGGNKITIKDTSALLNGSKFSLTGTIDTDTKTDIKIQSDPLKIADIVKLAKEFGIVKEKDIKDYSFNNGTLSAVIKINGKLQNIVPSANISLDKLAMNIKSLKMPVNLEKLTIVANPDDKNKNDFIAKIEAANFKAAMKNPVFNINAPKCTLEANSKDLKILPFNLMLQGTNINISGDIKDYMTKPDLLFNIDGKLNPNTLLSFIPAQNKKLVAYQGQMPLSAKISGNMQDIKINGTLSSDAKNYISIIDVKNIKDAANQLILNANIKGDTLIINNIALNSKGTDIATVTGKINKMYSTSPTLSPLNIVTARPLAIAVPVLDNLSLEVESNLALTGNTQSPQINGSVDISNLNWSKYGVSAKNAVLDFKKSVINAQASEIKVAGSDFAGSAEISSKFGKIITINSLNFTSGYIDADGLMKLTASMPNTQTTAGPSLPLEIKKGTAKISKLKSGTITAQSITSDFNLKNNLFTLSNINAIFADGKITADATYNIASTKVTVDGVGKAINARKAASCFVGGSSVIVGGTLNGIAKLNLLGTTYEQQMKTLNGQVIFDITNGQYGEAARFESFLHAGNLLTQSLLNLNLNQTISAVTSRNTGEFKSMEGKISLSNGWANIISFESSGPNMSLYATGKYNILTSNCDLKVLGRISSTIVNVLGPLGSFSLNNVVSKLPEKGLAILNTIKSIAPSNSLFADIKQSDLDKIPALSAVSDNAASKDFQVLINGPITKTTSIKSFKWANKETPQNTTTTSTTQTNTAAEVPNVQSTAN